MKAKVDCVLCLQRQAIQAIYHITNDEEVREHVLRDVMQKLLELEWFSSPIEMAGAVHKVVRTITKTRDPYEKVKKGSNDLVLELYPQLKSIVEGSDDALRTAVELAIAGNIIDFGALKDFNLKETIREVTGKKLLIDDYDKFREKLKEVRSLLFFADNAGEIVFDKLLLETILREKSFQRIGFVVKGGPIINDATLEDAYYIGLDELPNIEFLTVSNSEEGTGPAIDSQTVKQWIDEFGTVLSKGQANYEGLCDFSGVFFMLMVKCSTIASDIGANINDAVLKYNS